MSLTLHDLGLDRLNREERIAVAHALIESVAPENDSSGDEPIPADLLEDLRARVADAIARPESGIPWEQVSNQMLRRAGK